MKYEIITKKQIELLEDYGIEKLTESEKIQYIVSKGYYDIEFFGDFFLYNWLGKKTPDLHREIWATLRGEDNACVICPRGHGKTTSILIDIIQSLCYEIYGSQLYIATAGLGEESLGKIRNELETNKLIREAFGNLVPKQTKKDKEVDGTKKWRAKQIQLLNGETIETLSKGQSVRGKRPKRIVVDDLDENKDVMTKSVVEKTRTWFFSSLYNTLLPGGKVVILGTIVGNMCMVKYIRDIKKWKTIEYKAINNGVPLWEDMWPLSALEERKKAIGSAIFNQEFMNIPIQAENTLIKEEHIKYFDYIGEQFEYVTVGVDPAISEKTTSDSFAIIVTGVNGVKNYVLEERELRGKEKDPFNATKIVKYLYDKYRANIVVVETVAFQQVMSKLFKEEGMAVKEINPHRDKVTRLMEHQNKFEKGEVYFNREKTYNLVEQLLQFPDVEHDDLVDALVYSFRNQKKKIVMVSL